VVAGQAACRGGRRLALLNLSQSHLNFPTDQACSSFEFFDNEDDAVNSFFPDAREVLRHS